MNKKEKLAEHLTKYVRDRHNIDECNGFIDGFNMCSCNETDNGYQESENKITFAIPSTGEIITPENCLNCRYIQLANKDLFCNFPTKPVPLTGKGVHEYKCDNHKYHFS